MNSKLIWQEILRAIVLVSYMRVLLNAIEEISSAFELFAVCQLFSAAIFIVVTSRITFTLTADSSTKALIATFACVLLPLGISRGHLIDSPSAITLILSGLAISGVALFELWDCFDILPSYRGLTSSGLYKIVRHPIYFGYVLVLFGINLGSFSISNLVLSSCLIVCLDMRARLEESALLNADSKYSAYLENVPSRIIPWIY